MESNSGESEFVGSNTDIFRNALDTDSRVMRGLGGHDTKTYSKSQSDIFNTSLDKSENQQQREHDDTTRRLQGSAPRSPDMRNTKGSNRPIRPKTGFELPDSRQRSGVDATAHSESINDVTLPKVFTVKYLGKCDTTGLWGIKHTRKPVDAMVTEARQAKSGVTLPYLKLTVSEDGVDISAMPQNRNENFESGLFPIHMISYGVQDLVYTRVFAMITVRDTANVQETHPFLCHGFVCDSRQTARQLTFSLANAFKVFSESIKAKEFKNAPKRFAIDLRAPGELHNKEELPIANDSEV